MAEVDGLDALVSTILAVEKDVKTAKSVFKSGAQIVERQAKSNARKRSGKLRRSGRSGATKKGGNVKFGSKRVPWALPYHFGHKNRPQGGFMRPDPFLYEAGDKRAEEVRQAFEDHVNKII